MVSAAIFLLPLYIYPSSNAWNPLTKVLKANPNLHVQAIINPDNGPGEPPYPNSDYISAIAGLNKFPNLQTLCYVATNYGERDPDDVKADIDTCANWATYKEADIYMSGIFFDEVSSSFRHKSVTYLRDISAHARSALKSTKSTNIIVYNPGVIVDTRFYASDLADYIVVFENAYSEYKPAAVLSQISPAIRKQSMELVYGFTNTTAASAQIVKSQVTVGGIAGLGLATFNGYEGFSAQLDAFAAQMAAA